MDNITNKISSILKKCFYRFMCMSQYHCHMCNYSSYYINELHNHVVYNHNNESINVLIDDSKYSTEIIV